VHLPNGKQCGHLSADMAEDYSRVISTLAAQRPVFHDGDVESWDGGLGVQVYLPDVDLLTAWAAAAPAARVVMPMRRDTPRLKRSGDYQEELKAVSNSRRVSTKRTATVTGEQTP
jgi:hypothetical protein